MPKPKNGPKGQDASTEVLRPSQKRRSFSPAEKVRIVREANECLERGQIEALLRREGIYSSHLSAWRKQIQAHGVEGIGLSSPGRKSKRDAKDRRIDELQRELAGAQKELVIANGLIALQKKLSELLGLALPASEAR